jgi:hypothetical protein
MSVRLGKVRLIAGGGNPSLPSKGKKDRGFRPRLLGEAPPIKKLPETSRWRIVRLAISHYRWQQSNRYGIHPHPFS